MTNEEKVKKIAPWIDPEERVTVNFLDARDLNAEVTGCSSELVDLAIETNVTHMKQRISVPLSRTDVTEDLSHYTRDPERPAEPRNVLRGPGEKAMEEVKLPELGENIETVEVSAVLVAVGDRISAQQPVVEVETEKASLEVPSTVTGKVEEILVAVGGQVRVGEPFLRHDPRRGEDAEGDPHTEDQHAQDGHGRVRGVRVQVLEPAPNGQEQERQEDHR